MCGIAGKIHLNDKALTEPELEQMADEIAYRGPDDSGVYISTTKKVGLANRRLAIIDLSKRGHMPLAYKNRYFITYNGEIYNFQREKEQLVKKGHRFKTKTDTEVILALYDEYKTKCLSHLRGMFAFAIYDSKEKVLFAARDRMGQKPFKYYYDNSVFIFASELKAILTQSEVGGEPDFLDIHDFLTYGYVPAPNTGFVGIKKLPPAHYLVLDTKNKKLEIKRYWDIDFVNKLELSEKDWCTKIIDTLKESTRLRMISDVPLGAFLSGGVDSSGVVATMARFSKDPVKTFSIRFAEKRYDETIHARRMAKLYNTDHHELMAKPNSVDLLPKLAYLYEEPFADASTIVTSMVSSMARSYVTVVLNGDGGDENFTGYDRHLRINRDAQIDRLGKAKKFGVIGAKLASRMGLPHGTQAYKFFKKSLTPLAHRYVSYNSYLRNDTKDSLYTGYFKNLTSGRNSYDFANEVFKNAGNVCGQDRGLYFDLTSYLPNDLLTKVDIASMSVSLEARSPLLDHELVELAAKIPYKLKVKSGETKYIFKKALEGIVPKENLYRPKKGFSVPLDKWFEGDLGKYARSKLLGGNSTIAKLFKKEGVKAMLDNHSETNDFGPQLWAILSLELWFECYHN